MPTSTTNSRFIPEYLPHWVEFQDFDHETALAAIAWCQACLCETFDWTIHAEHTDRGRFKYRGIFFFLDPKDAAFFALKWL